MIGDGLMSGSWRLMVIRLDDGWFITIVSQLAPTGHRQHEQPHRDPLDPHHFQPGIWEGSDQIAAEMVLHASWQIICWQMKPQTVDRCPSAKELMRQLAQSSH